MVSRDELGPTRPDVFIDSNGDVFVTTITALDRPANGSLYEAAAMMESKFKSRQAVLEALYDEQVEPNVTQQCKDTNKVGVLHVHVSKIELIYYFHVHDYSLGTYVHF